MLRLILALVLAIASLPVPAAAHDGAMVMSAPMAMSGHATDGMEHKAPMPMLHDCIGCIAVADWNGARIVPPVSLQRPAYLAPIAAMRLLPGEAPVPPPPRTA